MKNVLLAAAEGEDYKRAQDLAMEVMRELHERNVVAHSVHDIDVPEVTPDLVICVGGDGTIVQAMKKYSPYGIPVFGINGGDVGFLSAAEEGTYRTALDELVHGRYVVESRTTLKFVYQDKSYGPFINEVKLWHPDTIITYDLEYEGRQIYGDHFRTRGVLVATQTGSTAENRSAGHGNIIMPGTRAHALTPLHPYGLNTPPTTIGYLAQGGSLQIGPQKLKYDVPVEVHADGRKILFGDTALKVGECVIVSEHPRVFLLVTFGLESFQNGLRKKGFA